MDGLGYQFLARAALAHDEHRSRGGRDAGHQFEHLLQGCRTADNLAEPCRVDSRETGRLRLVQFERRAHRLQQGAIVPRLGHEVKRPGLHSLDGKLDAPPSRHQDDGHTGLEHLHFPEQPQALLPARGEREIHVHQYQFKCLRTHQPQSLFRPGHGRHLVARTLEKKAERGADGAVIVYNQYHASSNFFMLQN